MTFIVRLIMALLIVLILLVPQAINSSDYYSLHNVAFAKDFLNSSGYIRLQSAPSSTDNTTDKTPTSPDTKSATAPGQATVRMANVVVAASDAPASQKVRADYVVVGNANDELQAAINAGAGGLIHLTKGTFTVGKVVTIPSNTTIEGEGPSTIVTLAANANSNIFQNSDPVGGNSNITFKSMLIDGNQTKQTGAGQLIRLAGASVTNITLQNLEIKNAKLCCLTIFPTAASNIVIQNVVAHGIPAGGQSAISFYNTTGITLDTIEVYDSVAAYSSGVYLNKCSDVSVRNVKTHGFLGAGGWGFTGDNVSMVRISDAHGYGNTTGIAFINACSNIQISNSEAYNNGASGFLFWANASTISGVQVSNCISSANGATADGAGFFFYGCDNVQLTNDWSVNNHNRGFMASNVTRMSVMGGGASGTTHNLAGTSGGEGFDGFKLSESTIVGFEAYGNAWTGIGIDTTGPGANCVISRCIAHDNGWMGIYAWNSGNVSISDCQVWNNGKDVSPVAVGERPYLSVGIGIYDVNSSDALISGNKVWDDQISKTQTYGLYIGGYCSQPTTNPALNCVVTNNDVTGSGSLANVYLQGTGHTIADNKGYVTGNTGTAKILAGSIQQ